MFGTPVPTISIMASGFVSLWKDIRSLGLCESRCKGQGSGRREDIGVGILRLCIGHRE